MAGPAILIVDDEKNILSSLQRALRVEGYDADVAGGGTVALEKVAKRTYDLVLLDVQMPDLGGIEVLKRIRAEKNDVPVVVMSGHGTTETAVQAVKLGAHDFIDKPLSTEKLLVTIENALSFERLARENRELRARSGASGALLGSSASMNGLRRQIQLAASASAPVLIHGESGTGKELVARAIHEGSKRRAGPLEKLNCAAVPSELIESELFGHEQGAFTGATKQRRGKFERAHGGSLFLDEVGDMPAAMQAKLLRVLQEGEIERVGGNETLKVDVRVVAATNKVLTDEVAASRFRQDLYYRLNVVPIDVPPLRDRREDIPELVDHFLEMACAANDRRGKRISPEAVDLLRSSDFPGNVRELRNLVERLVILTAQDQIGTAEVRALLPLAKGGGRGSGSFYSPATPLRDMVAEAEKDLVLRALEHHGGHITRTAQDLQIERSHLYKKMRALGIRPRPGEDTTPPDDEVGEG
ncbi:MAG: sigma-54-dependent Fis family transcriptional regulator [Deltaproteobacteria bacterium]|nr:sigma-54-dependent Fis family transcriptional regulator [Deltaproteobacteria bacterium]